LTLTLVLVATYMLAEVVGALLSNSLALLADAGHMLTDVAALALTLFAMRVARRPATAQHSYGFFRVEILAALANGSTLVAIALLVFIEGIRRLAHPPEVVGSMMLAVAVGGLAVNLACLGLLHRGRGESLNLRGAWLHLLTDTLGSVQAIVAGSLVAFAGWRWADPVASLLIGVLVLISAWGLVRDSLAVLMEGVPGHLDLDRVREAMLEVDGVASVHDLHVWTIASGFVALSAHVVPRPGTDERLLWRVQEMLHVAFGIHHTTIQVELQPAPQGILSTRRRP
jgi:cobalt-zinc-cadmium efflux system protein